MLRQFLVSALVLAVGVPTLAQDEFQTVAIDGDDVPGFRNDESLQVFASREFTAIAADGTVIFDGSATNGSQQREVLVLDDGDRQRVVYFRFGDAPASLPGYTLQTIQTVRLGAGGGVAVEAFLDGTPDRESHLLDLGSGLVEGVSAPGATFSDLSSGFYAFNGGTLAFLGTIPLMPTGSRRGMWVSTNAGAPTSLLQIDGTAPGLGGRTITNIFSVPIVHENGSVAFEVSLDSEGEPRRALYAFTPQSAGGAPTLIRGYGVNDQLASLTFGEAESASVLPRIGYIVEVGNVYTAFDGNTAVMMTGDTSDGRSLLMDGRSRIALGSNGHVVVAANHTGSVSGESVWRFVPQIGVSCELATGMFIDDQDGNPREITDIWNVHVSEDGRVAAEVDLALFGTTQVIVIQDTPGGAYRVAVQQRKSFTTGNRVRQVVGLQSQRPTHFTMTGTGHDGRQSRFSPSGAFVFRARFDTPDDSTDRNGVFLLGLPEPEKCDVKVRMRGRNLSISGGKGDCDVSVVLEAGGRVEVIPGPDTTLNGEEEALDFVVQGSISAKLGGGRNMFSVRGVENAPRPVQLARNLTYVGSGEDIVDVSECSIGGSLKIRLGPNATNVDVREVMIGKSLSIATPSESALINVFVTEAGKTASVSAGGRLLMEENSFGGLKVRGSNGDDDIEIGMHTLGKGLVIDTGAGTNAKLTLGEIDIAKGNTVVKAKKTRFLDGQIEDLTMQSGGFSMKGTTAGSTLAFLNLNATKDVRIQTFGTAPGQSHTIGLDTVDTPGAVSVKASGSHSVTATAVDTGEGISINIRNGVTDEVTVRNSRVGNGLLFVASKAFQGLACLIDNCGVDKGALSVRSGEAEDRITVTACEVQGRLQVTANGGDDVVRVNDNGVGTDLRLFGGTGTDLLDNGRTIVNEVGGKTIEDSFEGDAPALE